MQELIAEELQGYYRSARGNALLLAGVLFLVGAFILTVHGALVRSLFAYLAGQGPLNPFILLPMALFAMGGVVYGTVIMMEAKPLQEATRLLRWGLPTQWHVTVLFARERLHGHPETALGDHIPKFAIRVERADAPEACDTIPFGGHCWLAALRPADDPLAEPKYLEILPPPVGEVGPSRFDGLAEVCQVFAEDTPGGMVLIRTSRGTLVRKG